MGSNITVIPWIYVGPSPSVAQTPSIVSARDKTRLGLVGETLRGPAFKPTFIKDGEDFFNTFGSPSIDIDGVTRFPRYELPYIANAYLNSSDSLFVTRVLGLSGYDAGSTWAITLKADFNNDTVGPTNGTGVTYSSLFSFTADSQGIVTRVVSSDSLIQTLWDNKSLIGVFDYLDGDINQPTDSNYTGGTLYKLSTNISYLGSTFTGFSINDFYLKNYTSIIVGSDINYTGQTSGVTVYYSASTYDEVEDLLIATIRSKSYYDDNENLIFNLGTGISSLSLDPTVSGATNNIFNDFKFKWTDISGVTGSTIVSFDTAKNNYIGTVLSKEGIQPIYLDSYYRNLVNGLSYKIKGINLNLVNYSTKFSNYKEKFKPSVTPWIVSQIKASFITKLFRFWSIGDGDYTNDLFKVTISNIRLMNSENVKYDIKNPDGIYDDYKFDVTIRPINEFDSIFKGFTDEIYERCSMNPKSTNYIGKMIGTRNGDYPSKSKYVTVEINEEGGDLSLTFPAGFLGYPQVDYDDISTRTVKRPFNVYKTSYDTLDIIENNYLGLSDSFGFDKDMFKYHGVPNSTTRFNWTGMTKGFHMDINATGVTLDDVNVLVNNINYEFEVGNAQFVDEQLTLDTSYVDLNTRKFTLLPYGGFDGWDINRLGRTNLDTYRINNDKGILGEQKDNFNKITLTDNSVGLNSDYYAFLEGIWTFKDIDNININLFATPGLDTTNHNRLIEEAIDFIEYDRADSLYIVTIPDVNPNNKELIDVLDVVTLIEGNYDSSYVAAYWPWVKLTENGVWLPPTVSVVSNFARNDNSSTSFPWIAVAGVDKGRMNVFDIRRNPNGDYLSRENVNYLYTNRINPLIYTKLTGYEGYKIWGNKTLSTTDSLTNRVHIRRLLIEVKDIIIKTCRPFLFEQNDNKTKRDLEKRIIPELTKIKENRGIVDFKLKFDTTIEEIDKGYLKGKIFIKPVNAIEYIVFIFSILPKTGELSVELNQE